MHDLLKNNTLFKKEEDYQFSERRDRGMDFERYGSLMGSLFQCSIR